MPPNVAGSGRHVYKHLWPYSERRGGSPEYWVSFGARWPPEGRPEPENLPQATGGEAHQEPGVAGGLWTGSRVSSEGGFRAGGAGRLLGGFGCTKMATAHLHYGAPSSSQCNRRSSDPSWPAPYTSLSGGAAADESGMDRPQDGSGSRGMEASVAQIAVDLAVPGSQFR